MSGAQQITAAIRAANEAGHPALVPFITAGHPDRDSFAAHLAILAEDGDVVEIGVPFTDPLADGVTIQRSSEAALKAGVSLNWILDMLRTRGRTTQDAGGADELSESAAEPGL